jgi:replicative DNA helicase
MLSAMLNSKIQVGAVSVEDGVDVVGTRILSALTGIDSLRIRRKALTEEELMKLNAVAKSPPEHMHFAFNIAEHITVVERSVAELARAGCKLVWLDYIQEVSGTRKDRKDEVTEVLSRCHHAAASNGASLMAISQFRRLGDQERAPQIYHLKESGNLENKARIIVLAHRVRDEENSDRVRFRLAKSVYGAEHLRWDMVRDGSGTLQVVATYDPTENF